MVHSGCTYPTQATARLGIVLVSRIQKNGTGGDNFVKWKGTFRSDQLKWPDRSEWTTFKAAPEYSSRTKPKWLVPFDVPTEISGFSGCMKSTHGFINGMLVGASSETQGQIVGARESLNRRKNMAQKKSKERREEPLGTMSYQTSSKRSPPFWLLIGARKTQVFWHQR